MNFVLAQTGLEWINDNKSKFQTKGEVATVREVVHSQQPQKLCHHRVRRSVIESKEGPRYPTLVPLDILPKRLAVVIAFQVCDVVMSLSATLPQQPNSRASRANKTRTLKVAMFENKRQCTSHAENANA